MDNNAIIEYFDFFTALKFIIGFGLVSAVLATLVGENGLAWLLSAGPIGTMAILILGGYFDYPLGWLMKNHRAGHSNSSNGLISTAGMWLSGATVLALHSFYG